MRGEKKANGSALLPYLVFVAVYLGFGIYYTLQGTDMAFYQFPIVTAMLLACVVSFFQGSGKIDEKFATFSRGPVISIS